MEEYTGTPVSPGYGHGPCFLYKGSEGLFEQAAGTPFEGTEIETGRFADALVAARREIEAFQRSLGQDYGTTGTHVLHAQLLMLEDPALLDGVRMRIRERSLSAEAAVAATVRELERKFQGIGDSYIRERALDVHDVGCRILRCLADRTHHPLSRVPAGAIIVAERLLPTDTLFLDRARVAGIVTERGGENSHAAILARSLGIPAVTQVGGILAHCKPGVPVMVDGLRGRVLVDVEAMPDDLAERAMLYQVSIARIRDDSALRSVTRDGVEVRLLANIGRLEDVDTLEADGAAGIGLLRTEFLYMTHGADISEDRQYVFYRRLAERLGERPLTVRTLDLAPDKILPLDNELPFGSAAVTERGVHYSLRHQELFLPQLRAILRAARHGQVRLLLPFVTGVSEIRAVRALLCDLSREFERAGEGPPPVLPVGAMIETTPAVLMAAEIAKEADFLSIGSNDLLRHLFSARWQDDRPDGESAFEPSLLRAIDLVVRASERTGKTVALCGEMAGGPPFTALLIGLGLRELSMSPKRIAEVRYNVRATEASRARALANEALSLATAGEVRALLARHLDPWDALLGGEAPP